jgi:hypothetical protein
MRFPGRALDPAMIEDASHAVHRFGTGGRTLALWGSALLALVSIVWVVLMVLGVG